MEKIDFFDTPAPPHRGYFLSASRDEPKTTVSEKTSKMTSKMIPKSLPGASQDALGAQFLLDAASGPIFDRFSPPPGISKIELSPRRRAIFHEFTFSAWAPKKHSKIVQK